METRERADRDTVPCVGLTEHKIQFRYIEIDVSHPEQPFRLAGLDAGKLPQNRRRVVLAAEPVVRRRGGEESRAP
jgi:hypothetical protein